LHQKNPSKRSQSGNGAVVFVHSGFRTSSTWLWLKFRQAKGTRAYYEPFNDMLASMDRAAATSFGPASWNSHHPLSDPYFTEFADFIGDEGGIHLYRPEMPIKSYVPSEGVDGELSVDEINYLSLLIEGAHRAGELPVLCDTRTLARSRALRKAFGGTHVLLTRNLHEQWCSFSEQAVDGNGFFFDSLFRQVEAGGHDPFLGHLAELAAKRQGRTDTAEAYALFLLSQLYSNAVAFDACQIHVDSTVIAANAVERRAVETRLSHLLHSEIDLSDARAHVSFSAIEARHRIPAEALAQQFLSKLVVPNASVECQRYVQRAFDEAFRCWDLSIYHCEATRAFLGKQMEAKSQVARELLEQMSVMEQHLHDLQVQLEGEVARAGQEAARAAGLEHQLHELQLRLEGEGARAGQEAARAAGLEHQLHELQLRLEHQLHDLQVRLEGEGARAGQEAARAAGLEHQLRELQVQLEGEGARAGQEAARAAGLEHQLHELQVQLEGEGARAGQEAARAAGLEHQLHELQLRLEGEGRKVALAETMAGRARSEIHYVTHRSFWEALLFRPSGKPKKALRRLLFHMSGKPRGVFKPLVLHPDGRPHKPFRMWMSSNEYQSLHAPVRLPDE
jgi:hypothetical protein